MNAPIKTSGNSPFCVAGSASKRQRLFAVADGVAAAVDAVQCGIECAEEQGASSDR